MVVLYLLVLALMLWWLMAHTPAGRYLYAIGGNAEAARLSGVRVNRCSTLALVLSSGIAGLGGVLFTSQSGPSLDFGPALLLPAFAAAFLGSTQLQPGKFNVWGTLLAIYVLATGVHGPGAGVRRRMAERHVQRRRADHRGGAVGQPGQRRARRARRPAGPRRRGPTPDSEATPPKRGESPQKARWQPFT